MRHIWSLSGSNPIQTHKHLVRKQTLNHLAKRTYLSKQVLYLRIKWQERNLNPEPLST